MNKKIVYKVEERKRKHSTDPRIEIEETILSLVKTVGFNFVNERQADGFYIWSNFIDDDTENYFSKSENRYFLHNAFTFYKKETLIKYPFDEVLIGKEDRYWVNNRIKDGMKSYYDSAIKCYHHYTENGATWKGLG